ncbi:MAG: translocation/assembly module TamB domain-containing protein, partial [Flavobacteriales bacterium]|nr:translocation/assembly module TamB domain-containing protein [Flavobacteriales bacterium]
SSVSESTREEVLMTIYLTGYLNSPVYTFNIEMPKAPENVREELAYKLSDQEQLNQQFISLMVFNSFTNTGGENQNPNMVATGVTGLATGVLSNQFSNIVQKFVSGVDIGVSLNTSSDRFTGNPTNTDFEVAISKNCLMTRLR